MELRIDIVSDVVCPWCIIGYKRLEKALATFADRITPKIVWHPFELNPQMPAEGQNLREHLAKKYGTTKQGSIEARRNLTSLGAALGFTFNYFDEMRMFNTFKAHQLLFWAAGSSLQTALKLRLFRAYFGEQQDISDTDVLLKLVAEVGLDQEQAKDALKQDGLARAVRAEEHQWLERGIRGVPAIIFNERTLVSGAQEVETFEAQIGQLLRDTAKA